MPHAVTARCRLWYEASGSGAPVIFLHGYTLDSRMWTFGGTWPLLDPSYYQSILLDARGHGQSEVTESSYSRTDRVADLVAFLDTISIDRAHLVGLSMGGSTVLGALLDHPDRVISAILISTGAAGYRTTAKVDRLFRIARDEGREAAARLWIDWSTRFYREDQSDIESAITAMMEQHSYQPMADPHRPTYVIEPDLPRLPSITAPVRILAGRDDKAFAQLAELLHQGIANSELAIYDAVGHMLPMESPERFSEDLRTWFSDHP